MPESPISLDAEGTLLTYTVIRKPPAVFADEGVYAVCVVDMACGVRVTGRLDEFEPEPALGVRVSVTRFAGEAPVFTTVAQPLQSQQFG